MGSSLAPFEKERTIFPDMDVFENDKMFQITAELPGLAEEDIKVEFNNNFLIISGEKKLEKEDKGNNYYICLCNDKFDVLLASIILTDLAVHEFS